MAAGHAFGARGCGNLEKRCIAVFSIIEKRTPGRAFFKWPFEREQNPFRLSIVSA